MQLQNFEVAYALDKKKYIYLRPHIEEFLLSIAKFCEIVIYCEQK